MPRSRPVPAPSGGSAPRRNRHGRGARGPITGPELPSLSTRIDAFELTVAQTADYLKGLWPDELGKVSFEVAAAPQAALGGSSVQRWWVDPVRRRVVLFRVPIQRLGHLHRDDDLHRRMLIEGCVFRAVAELLGKDPWDLAPERFRDL